MNPKNILAFVHRGDITPSPQATKKIAREYPSASDQDRLLLSKVETLLDAAMRYKAAAELITKRRAR